MRVHFRQPRTACVGHLLSPHIPIDVLPAPAEVSARLCEEHLPATHELPRFFRLREETRDQVVGQPELRAAYDRVHQEYDDFWVKEAGAPVRRLIEALGPTEVHRGLEAGCGTGFATALLVDRLAPGGHLLAVDLSPGMLSVAQARLAGRSGVTFRVGDALVALAEARDLDLVFSSWVLGYLPCRPFYRAAAAALRPGGRLAFVVHRDNSPREPLEIFAELVARDPSVLLRQVAFDFPRDADQVRTELEASGFQLERLWQGEITFPCTDGAAVVEHLLKSGAGTAFHDAVAPDRREGLMAEFRRLLEARHPGERPFAVVHEYLAAVAMRP
jgi:SAM-dependent methyltransferase